MSTLHEIVVEITDFAFGLNAHAADGPDELTLGMIETCANQEGSVDRAGAALSELTDPFGNDLRSEMITNAVRNATERENLIAQQSASMQAVLSRPDPDSTRDRVLRHVLSLAYVTSSTNPRVRASVEEYRRILAG